MTLASAAGTEKERIFAACNESARRDIKDETAIHHGIKSEVEVVVRGQSARADLLVPPSGR